MLGIVGNPIDPRGLAHSSLPQYENVHFLLCFQYLQIKQQEEPITRSVRRLFLQTVLVLEGFALTASAKTSLSQGSTPQANGSRNCSKSGVVALSKMDGFF